MTAPGGDTEGRSSTGEIGGAGAKVRLTSTELDANAEESEEDVEGASDPEVVPDAEVEDEVRDVD